MEGSAAAAGPGQGQAAQGDGGGEAQAPQQQGQGPDVSQLAQQFEAMSASQAELMDLVRGLQQPQNGDPQAPQDPQQPASPDLGFLEDPNALYDPQQFAAQMQQVIKAETQRGIQESLQPILEQERERDIKWESRELVDEFPELAKEPVAKEVIQLATELATQLGAPQLKDSPRMWRAAYLMRAGAQVANKEGSEQPGAAHLEGGGGATPGAPQANDLKAQILAANKGGSSVLPFH